MNATAIWESIPEELNWNVLKFLRAKELVGLKSDCKNATSTVKSEKRLLFYAIREQLDKTIRECGFESVLIAFKFKVKSRVRLGGALGPVGLVMLSISPKDACKLSMMKTCLRREPTLSLVGTWELCMFVHTLGRLLESWGVIGWMHVGLLLGSKSWWICE